MGASAVLAPPERFEAAVVLALFLLALAHRLLFLRSGEDRSWPFSVFYFGDTRVFYEHALALLQGLPHEDGIPLRPPLFPRILAAVYGLVGADGVRGVVPHTAVRSVFAAVAAATPPLLYLLVRPCFGRWGAFAFALPWVWHFGALVLAVAPVVEGTYLTLLAAVLLLWTRRVPSPLSAPGVVAVGPWTCGAVGVGLGLLQLLRAEAVVVGVAVVLLTAAPLGPMPRRQLRWGAFLLGGWLIALVPSTVVNWRNLDAANRRMEVAEPLPRFVAVSLYGPLNFALANAAGADGRFSVTPLETLGSTGGLDLEQPGQLALVLHGDEAVWQRWRAEPGQALGLVVAKWRIAGRALALGWGGRNWPGGLSGQREPVDLFTPDRRWGVWLWLPFAVFGAVAAWRRGRDTRPVLGLVALVSLAPALATTLYFGYVRQLVLLLPVWLGLAGYGAFAVAERSRVARHLPRLLGGLAVVVLATELALAAAGSPRLVASGSVDQRGKIIQDAAVRLTPTPNAPRP